MVAFAREKRAWFLFGSLPLIFTLFLVVFTLGETFYEREALINHEKSLLGRMTQLVSLETRDLFIQIQSFLKSADLWIESRPDMDPRVDPQFNRLVEDFRNLMGRRIDIRMVSDQGELYYLPSQALTPLADVKDRDYYQVQRDGKTRGFFIGLPVKSRVSNQWTIPLSYPLTQKTHGLAVIFATLELPVISSIYENARPQPSGNITLTRLDGLVMARAPFDEFWMAKKVFDPEKIKFKPGLTDDVIIYTPAQNGEERLLGYRVMEGFPYLVTVSVKLSDALSTWEDGLGGRFLLLSCGLIGIGLLSWRGFRLVKSLELATRKLVESNLQLEKSNATKDKLFSVISHDLRSPISAINNLLEILSQEDQTHSPETLTSVLGTLSQTAGKTFHLLENLLSWSKSNQEAIHPQISEIHLKVLADDTAQLFELAAKTKGIHIGVEVGDHLKVAADPDMIKTILRNLLSNAIKFTPAQGHIRIVGQGGGGEVSLTVSDDGIGMDEETRHGLFNLSTTRVRSGTAHERGSGLGLVLCQDFAQKNQATLEVTSLPGKGTHFTLRFHQA